MLTDIMPVNKKKLKGWVGIQAAARTRKARAKASRPARDPSKRNRTNPKMGDVRYRGPQVFPEFA